MLDAARSQIKPSPLGFRFRALPSEVMASRTLSSTAKLLFAAIVDAARGNRSGLCKVANATLGDRIGRSESEVGRYLIELEAAGLVRREYGRTKNVRVGVAVTWSEAVPDDPGTRRNEVPDVRGPGSATIGDQVPRDPGPGKIPASDPRERTEGPILSTPGGEDRKPAPAEIAAALRLMVGGRYAPALFDAQPPPASSTSQAPDVAVLARKVGYSAVAAAGFVRRDRRPPCPTPRDGAELARMRAARAESLRDRKPFGGMANPGKL